MAQAVAGAIGWMEPDRPVPMHLFLVDWSKDRSFWRDVTRALWPEVLHELKYDQSGRRSLSMEYEAGL